MISLTLILAALVLLTSWDAAAADDHQQTVAIRTDDEPSSFNR
jgi:hypothetical protein